MKRRDLLHQFPAWRAAPALAQTPASPKLLVVLTSFAKANVAELECVTRQELARLGWRVGDNLRLESRFGDNRPERLDELARELAALQPAAALTVDMLAVRALMRQMAPSARCLAGLFDRSIFPEGQLDAAMAGPRRIAQQVGLEYLPPPVRNAAEIEAALRSLALVREHVLLVNTDPLMIANLASIAALARTLRLPSGAQHQSDVRSGGLFGHGPDFGAIWLRAVQMADQVLRGQTVGEIPFEQPTRILTLNRDTARSIGLTSSQELMLPADEVIG
jgi:putative tryptophan/tyrosine transport system substrate-binding protein